VMRFNVGPGEWILALAWVAIWVAFVALVLVLLILAIRWFLRAERGPGSPAGGGPPGGGPAGPDPLAILRERYARGEIDDEEFERRRKMLGG